MKRPIDSMNSSAPRPLFVWIFEAVVVADNVGLMEINDYAEQLDSDLAKLPKPHQTNETERMLVSAVQPWFTVGTVNGFLSCVKGTL